MRAGVLFKTVSTLVAICTTVLVIGCALSRKARAEPQTSAPHQAIPDDAAAPAVKKTQSAPSLQSQNILVVPVPALTPQEADRLKWSTAFHRRTYYYPFQRELTVFVGGITGVEELSNSTASADGAVFGITYLSHAWEGGGEYSTAGREQFWFARRRVNHSNDAFRPYFSYGVMHDLIADEQLASFSDWDNYLARVAIGFEDIITPPRSVQFELVAAAGLRDYLFLATCGLSWGF